MLSIKTLETNNYIMQPFCT